MNSFLTGQLHHQTSALVEEVMSQWMDEEEISSFIQTIKSWREKTVPSEIKFPIVAPYSTELTIDKVSLILVPLVASVGVVVSRFSKPLAFLDSVEEQTFNRLTDWNSPSDKLQSIPGFQTFLNPKKIKDQLSKTGAVLYSPPKPVASFFKKTSGSGRTNSFQDLRDSLVCRFISSILISGVNGASFDIKVGESSLLKNAQEARNFALSLKNVCSRMNIDTSFLLSDMNQPLGQAVGNSLEVREVLDIFKGNGPLDDLKLALELGTEILLLSKKFSDRIEAKKDLKKKIAKGEALNKFKEIIEAQKGNPRIIDDYSLLPLAKERTKVTSPKNGFINKLLMNRINSLYHKLGTEQKKFTDSIDHGAGFLIFKKIGDRVGKGEILAEVHFNNVRNSSLIDKEFQEIFMISDNPPDFQPLIIERI